MLIRDATEADVPAITEITNEVIESTFAIWHPHRRSVDDRLRWFRGRTGEGFPVLVAAEGAGGATGDALAGGDTSTVLGFASYGHFRDPAAVGGFRWTAEHSVHVRSGARGRGVGGALIGALVGRARAAGIHALVAAVDAENTGSIRLHARHGFVEVGRLREVGAHRGTWRDLVLQQLTLDDRSAPPGAAGTPTVS